MFLIGKFAYLEVKIIGSAYPGELQGEFDEGEQDFVPQTILNRNGVGGDGYG